MSALPNSDYEILPLDATMAACSERMKKAFPSAYANAEKTDATKEERHNWKGLLASLHRAISIVNRIASTENITATADLLPKIIDRLVETEKELEEDEPSKAAKQIAELNVEFAIIAEHMKLGKQFDVLLAKTRQNAAMETTNAAVRT